MNARFAASVALLAFFAFSTTSCGDKIEDFVQKNKPIVLKTLNLAGRLGAYEGLKQWAKKDEAAAKEAAAALNRNLKNEILPYFEGGEFKTSAEVDELINSSLFKDIPEEVKIAIVAAAEVLDFYLPVPGSENLNQDQHDYLKAFLTGLQSGVEKFLGKLAVPAAKRAWISG